jgi:hypothetical protein
MRTDTHVHVQSQTIIFFPTLKPLFLHNAWNWKLKQLLFFNFYYQILFNKAIIRSTRINRKGYKDTPKEPPINFCTPKWNTQQLNKNSSNNRELNQHTIQTPNNTPTAKTLNPLFQIWNHPLRTRFEPSVIYLWVIVVFVGGPTVLVAVMVVVCWYGSHRSTLQWWRR